MFKKILIAVDEGESSERAVDLAVELATQSGGKLAVVHVLRPAPVYATGLEFATPMECMGDDCEDLFRAIRLRIPIPLLADEFIYQGEAAEEILRAARSWGADVIVCGTQGRRGLSHLVLGSTAESLVRRAHCPVLVAKAERKTAGVH